MGELHRKKHLVHYWQVALCDVANKAGYPQGETGDESVLGGRGGVVVTTATDVEVEIVVIDSETKPPEGYVNLACIEITVGGEGLKVGNETTADTSVVPCPMGRVHVGVFTNNADKRAVTSVVFRLTSVVTPSRQAVDAKIFLRMALEVKESKS